MKPTFFIAAAMLVAMLSAAYAGGPADAVRPFYDKVGYETDPEFRAKFVDPAKSKLEENDKLSGNGEEVGCIDWALSIDAQDYDEQELAKTLKLSEKEDGDKATVTATFNLFENQDSAGEVIWSLQKAGGEWKISDIASKTGDWKLSSLDCQ
ncbi:DUF3828 domain-containing protein [Mesorhizobium sp. BAC0120]|uniref:DUF3828 domain-containing protein n=1 Tax=Mesorhizobium sp. BAC0120 TaxID=3090670 RepID=UPI00298BF5CE|nr:DUF3828 domain-containing protein [Mesorhizobium sp. BAC0120]MDW6024114.1 DUF3828 domain-containing protein [Mesorhizobium sp. BAC0120]